MTAVYLLLLVLAFTFVCVQAGTIYDVYRGAKR